MRLFIEPETPESLRRLAQGVYDHDYHDDQWVGRRIYRAAHDLEIAQDLLKRDGWVNAFYLPEPEQPVWIARVFRTDSAVHKSIHQGYYDGFVWKFKGSHSIVTGEVVGWRPYVAFPEFLTPAECGPVEVVDGG